MGINNQSFEAQNAFLDLLEELNKFMYQFSNLPVESKEHLKHLSKSQDVQVLIVKLNALGLLENKTTNLKKKHKDGSKEFGVAIDEYVLSTDKVLFEGIDRINKVLEHYKLNTINLHQEYLAKYSK